MVMNADCAHVSRQQPVNTMVERRCMVLEGRGQLEPFNATTSINRIAGMVYIRLTGAIYKRRLRERVHVRGMKHEV